jgi:cytochrome d ubiquinol oxidase subunit II
VTGIILTAGFSLFPFVLPSSVDLASSLTLWDATSSQLVLSWMFWCSMVILPLILAYTLWSYRVMWGRVSREHLQQKGKYLY